MPSKHTHPFDEYVLEGASYTSKGKATSKESLDNLMSVLNDDLARAFPEIPPPYDNVKVLLLSWKENDAKNDEDCRCLSQFLETEYGYVCEEYQIMGSALNPDGKGLSDKVTEWAGDTTERTLSIVFHSGHAFSNVAMKVRKKARDLVLFPEVSFAEYWDQDTWDNTKFGIDYRLVMGNLTLSQGPVLHILECCGGGGAALGSEHELIAAACAVDPGKRSKAHYPQGHFLRAVINTMKQLTAAHGYFSVAELHASMVSKGPKMDPKLYIQPWYSLGKDNKRSITLGRPQGVTQMPTLSRKEMQKQEEHVLLKVTVEAGKAGVRDFHKWLTNSDRPSYVKRIKMVGYCPNKSYTLFLALPMSLYNVLPEHPAYEFLQHVQNLDAELFLPPTAQLPGTLVRSSASGHAKSQSYSGGLSSQSGNIPFRSSSSTADSSGLSENIRPSSSRRELPPRSSSQSFDLPYRPQRLSSQSFDLPPLPQRRIPEPSEPYSQP
ncbi:MAG: hypothetical protein Q9226_008067, partial [Calogaya cf. arnoldii]